LRASATEAASGGKVTVELGCEAARLPAFT
jgi:hypothetical protein